MNRLADVRIVLVRPLQPGNLGAAARAMANFGLEDLWVVDPPAMDLERARWMATGGKDLLEKARFCATVEEAVGDRAVAFGTTARRRRFAWPVFDLGELPERVKTAPGPVAILFGREDTGMDNADLAWCQGLMRIPTASEPSLNLSQAVLLTAWTLFDGLGWEGQAPVRQGDKQGQAVPERPPAPPADLASQKRLIHSAMDLLGESNYLDTRNPEQAEVALSNLLHRAQPTRTEVEVLQGMVKRLGWELKHRVKP